MLKFLTSVETDWMSEEKKGKPTALREFRNR
jgi:hypothetical protein